MTAIKNIVMVGAGNVGTHLARALYLRGFAIRQVFSRDIHKAQALAESVKAEAIDKLDNILPQSDLYILAVKDDAIQELAGKLRLQGTVVHTSGTAGLELLEPISPKRGVFYPLQTFSKERTLDWAELPVCIEGTDKEIEADLFSLAGALTQKVYKLSSEDRKWMHLAAVYVNNFNNHLLLEAQKITLERHLPFDILKPLAVETVLKAFDLGPARAQTGPARRGDAETMLKQIEMLPDEGLRTVYRLLSESIQREK